MRFETAYHLNAENLFNELSSMLSANGFSEVSVSDLNHPYGLSTDLQNNKRISFSFLGRNCFVTHRSAVGRDDYTSYGFGVGVSGLFYSEYYSLYSLSTDRNIEFPIKAVVVVGSNVVFISMTPQLTSQNIYSAVFCLSNQYQGDDVFHYHGTTYNYSQSTICFPFSCSEATGYGTGHYKLGESLLSDKRIDEDLRGAEASGSVSEYPRVVTLFNSRSDYRQQHTIYGIDQNFTSFSASSTSVILPYQSAIYDKESETGVASIYNDDIKFSSANYLGHGDELIIDGNVWVALHLSNFTSNDKVILVKSL